MFSLPVLPTSAPFAPLQSLQGAVKEYAPVTAGMIALSGVVESQAPRQERAQTGGDSEGRFSLISRVFSEVSGETGASVAAQKAVRYSGALPVDSGAVYGNAGFYAQLAAQQESDLPEVDMDAYEPRYRPLVDANVTSAVRGGELVNVLTYNAPPYQAMLEQGLSMPAVFGQVAGAYQKAASLPSVSFLF